MDQPTTQPDQAELDEFLGTTPPSARSRWIRWGLIALGVVALLFIVTHYLRGGGDRVRYATQPVERGNLTVTVSATGNLQPTNEVNVGSELSGLITTVLVDNNDRVRKGQVLARLDVQRLSDTVAQSSAALLAAQAAVGQAEATLAQNRATLNRYQQVYKLSGGKVPSGTELDTARADFARGQANLRSAQAQVAQAQATARIDRTQLGKASILSPVDGVVLSRQVEPGQTVAASLNVATLFVIAEDLSRMKLEAKVDEADVGDVKKGQRATFTVDAFPGRRFPARIARVDVGANATTSGSSSSSTTTTATSSSVVSYTAELSVANADLTLRPGMTATADIVTIEKQNALLVPNAALRFVPSAKPGKAGGGIGSMMMPRRPPGGGAAREVTIGKGSHQTVYVVGADGQPRAVPVTIGDTNGSQTEVTGALNPGDQVITGQKAAADAG